MEYPLCKLLSFTEHPDIIRRGGVVSVIKNCAFVKESHPVLLAPEDETVDGACGMHILPAILLPLCGPEEFPIEVRIP